MKLTKMWMIVSIAAVLAIPTLAPAQRSPEVALRAAMETETVKGDLKSAIDQYKRVAQSGNRTVAVQALLRMAECYQKLGDSESHKIYEQIVRDYADQKETAALARGRLGKALDPSASRLSFRQIWTGGLSGPISRDGRYGAYVDWDQGHGNLFLHDFSSDTNRPLTDTATDGVPGKPFDQFAVDASLSRDGRYVAYNWFRGDHNRTELRLIETKGDGVPQSRLLLDSQDVEWMTPLDWAPDGRSLALMLQRTDKTGQIALMSVANGALRVLKSVDWRGAQDMAFSPDGKYLAYDLPAGDNTEQRDVFVLATDGSREFPAIASPSQDILVGWSDDGKRLLFASDRNGSMALWSLPFLNGKVDGPPELLRRDIGQFARLSFAGGKLYGMVHFQNAGGSTAGDIYAATVDFATGTLLSPASLDVQTYVGNNEFPAWSPDGKHLAYASRRGIPGPEYFIIAIRSQETGEVREVSPAPGLKLLYTLAWTPDGRSFLAMGGDTKGRYGIFRVDAQTGQTSALMIESGGEGHPVAAGISTDGTKLYYGKRHWAGGDRGDSIWIEKDLLSGSEKELLRAPKWGPGLLSPDGRYLAIGGVDPAQPGAMFLLPVAGGEPGRLAQPGGILDWAADGNAIYALNRSGELWRIPINGDDRRKVNLKLEGNGVYGGNLRVHPDGRRIAFQTRPGPKPDEVWVLENFLPRSGN